MSKGNGCGNFGCALLVLMVGVPWLVGEATGSYWIGCACSVAIMLGLWVLGTIIVNTLLGK
ncbi:MAG: hypothetical protein ACLQNE_22450 [Thermoguttaceae bacterium]